MRNYFVFIILLLFSQFLLAQQETYNPIPEMGGGNYHPNYESYGIDKFIEEDQANYSGDLSFSIPLLTVPGRHGHNFDIKLNYNSNIHQQENASWVGLGWSLDLGSVERTVNGRTDEGHLNGNLGTRGNKSGRLTPDFWLDPLSQRDIADQYSLSIDGGGMEIMPVSVWRDSVFTISQSLSTFYYPFLPIKYKPWKIRSMIGDNGFTNFSVTKEDGTLYSFGALDAGAIESSYLVDDQYNEQSYNFPNRWNLRSIDYTDGSKTTISYQWQNPVNDKYYRRYSSVIIDRSKLLGDITGNYFGTISEIQPDYVLFTYAHPETLSTDTHYLVFITSSSELDDSTDRNCKLDQIILYEKGTNIELKRIKFQYASEPNVNEAWDYYSGTTNDWIADQRLNNGQLTLTSFTIQSGDIESKRLGIDEVNSADFQKYICTYTTNPKVNIELSVTRPYNYYWSGVYTQSSFATAWRLETLTLPTGGKYTYYYENLDTVKYDPEGNEAQIDKKWNYSSEPRCRINSKEFDDGIEQNRIWNYEYSIAVYDPPSCINQGTFIPDMYRNYDLYDTPTPEYYKLFRGCSVGHRYVKMTEPDGSWKVTYFTSSYPAETYGENKADYIASQIPPQYQSTIAISLAGQRGIIWKEESGKDYVKTSTNYYYSFFEQGTIKDRYDYFGMVNYDGAFQYVERKSFWSRLDSTKITIDGVNQTTNLFYQSTPRGGIGLGGYGNGLVSAEKRVGSDSTLWTSYGYAYYLYPEMDYNEGSRWMLSQLYSKTIGSLSRDVSKEYTAWEKINDHWLPKSEYIWNGPPTDVTAPDEHTDNNVLRTFTYNYDNSGYSNIVSAQDANDNLTNYYYSHDVYNPFTNTPEGLNKGYVTGLQKPQTSPLLKLSQQYDHFGNIKSSTDENGKITQAEYDDLGRIISVINPLNQQTQDFYYFMPNSISPSEPNYIQTRSYRSANIFTTTKMFYDGAGRERQKLITFGNLDIILPTVYDIMSRVSKSYKAYEVTLNNPHTYDIDFISHVNAYYNSSSVYKLNEYYNDGSSRLMNVHGEGNTSNHYLSYEYGPNEAVFDYASNKLFKTTIFDENNDYTNPTGYRYKIIEYKDLFGKAVLSVTDPDGLNLITRIKYDLLGRVIGIRPPSKQPYLYQASDNITLVEPNSTGTLTINLPIDTGEKTAYVKVTSLTNCAENDGINGIEQLPGPTVYYFIQQYQNNVLISQSPLCSIYCPGEDSRTSETYELLSNIDRIVLLIDDIMHPCDEHTAVVELKYKSIDHKFTSTYSYNKRGLLLEKTSADAGTVEYAYDKVGNLRLSKDANQILIGKFSFNKYDALNRLVQTGEYTGSSSFTNTNAENVSFPFDDDPNKVVNEQYYFDNSYYSGQSNLLGKLSKSTAYKQSNLVQTTYYSYYDTGLLEWLVRQIPGLPDVKIIYWYDFQGNPTKKCLSDATNGSVYTFYEYDAAGRLSKVYTNYVDSEVGKIKEAEYTYNADGTRKRVQLGTAQGMDYVYNERGWVKQINQQNFNITQDPGGDGGAGTTTTIDKFAEIIGYEEQGHIAAGPGFNFQPQYNGNISWLFTRTKDAPLIGVDAGYPGPMVGYVFNYDNASRLTKADFGYYHSTSYWNNSLPKSSMYELPSLLYDSDGNITGLQRYGVDATITNNFAYAYQPNTNRLATLTNTASGTQTYNYGYDQNGNVITDQLRDITNVVYNSNNLPEQLVNSIDETVNYTYDEGNNRIRKQDGTTDEYYILGTTGETEAVYSGSGSVKFVNILAGENLGKLIPITNNLSLTNITLVGNYQAQNSITAQTNVAVNGTAALKTPGTIYLKPGFRANSGCNFTVSVSTVETDKFYYLKDHLGSIRVTVDKLGEICSYDDYDPYGLQLAGRSGNFGYANDKYKFTGKERDTETGYDYFGARYYDSKIGRWLQVDPLADKYPGWSPYNYAANNPIKFVDPDGRFLVDGQYLSFSMSWGLKFWGSNIGINSRDNLFNPNAARDFFIGYSTSTIVEGLLQWSGKKGLSITYNIASGVYDMLKSFNDCDKTEYLWKAEQLMIADIYDLSMVDLVTGNPIKFVVDPQQMTEDYLKLNPDKKQNLLDISYYINPELRKNHSDKYIEEQLKAIRTKYVQKAIQQFWQDRWESNYGAEYQ